MYDWEGGTEKIDCGGTRLKYTLARGPAVGASSNPKHNSPMQTTGLTMVGVASEPALNPFPVRWEQVSEASTSPSLGLSSQNWLHEVLVDRTCSSHSSGVGALACELSTQVVVPLPG